MDDLFRVIGNVLGVIIVASAAILAGWKVVAVFLAGIRQFDQTNGKIVAVAFGTLLFWMVGFLGVAAMVLCGLR